MADPITPNADGEFTLKLETKDDRKYAGAGITADILESVERELQERIRIVGDVSPSLLYDLCDTAPSALVAFTRHHAQHFERRAVYGGELVEVAAVLFRHAFIVGVLAERRASRQRT